MEFDVTDFAFGSAPGILTDQRGPLSNSGLGFLDALNTLPDDSDMLNLSSIGNQLGSDNGLDFNFGMNIPTLRLGIGALGTLGGLYNSYKGLQLAEDKLDFVQDMAQTNLANEIQSYNTRLTDKANTAAAVNGWTDERRTQYVKNNQLSV